MFKSKRFLISVISCIFLATLALIGAFKSMEGLSSSCVGGILTIISSYTFAQTKRPSN